MAQLGDSARAKALLQRAARAFGPKEAVACARCVVAEAEIARVSREMGWPPTALDAAGVSLDKHGAGVKAEPARHNEVRRIPSVRRLDEDKRAMDELGSAAGRE